MTALLIGGAVYTAFASISVTAMRGSAWRSARAHLAPPKPPPMTTMRGAVPCDSSGDGNSEAAAPAAATDVRNWRRSAVAPDISESVPINPTSFRGASKAREPGMTESIRGAAALSAAAPIAHTMSIPWFFSGIERIRLPVARKNALSTAGAATQIVGSPTPPHGPLPPLGMMIDSTFGIWAIFIEL